MRRWLVIIARDRPEVWVTWAAFYGGAEQVEVLVERRQGQPWTGRGDRPDRRVPPHRHMDGRTQGFLVIPRPEMVGASR
jgi:hypothetical protein